MRCCSWTRCQEPKFCSDFPLPYFQGVPTQVCKRGFSTAEESKGCQFWVKLPALPALGAVSPVCHHHTALGNDPSQLVHWEVRVPARQEPLQVWRPQKHVNRVKYFGNLWTFVFNSLFRAQGPILGFWQKWKVWDINFFSEGCAQHLLWDTKAAGWRFPLFLGAVTGKAMNRQNFNKSINWSPECQRENCEKVIPRDIKYKDITSGSGNLWALVFREAVLMEIFSHISCSSCCELQEAGEGLWGAVIPKGCRGIHWANYNEWQTLLSRAHQIWMAGETGHHG